MFINKTNIKLLAAALLTALAVPSCMNLDETREGGYGYLTISGLDLDVQVEQLVPTKGGETVDISTITGYSAPSLGSVTVTSTTDQSKTYTWSGQDLKLPVGEYKLTTTSGTNGFNTPYFSGSGTVTVTALERVTGEVNFTLGNSVMKVTMAEGFDSHFTPAAGTPVTISNTSESASVAMDAYVFVPSGEELTVSVDGTSSAGVDKTYKRKVTPLIKTAYDVVLSATGVTMPTINFSAEQIAWGDRIYITNPATFSGNISDDNKAKLVYEAIPSTSSDWTNPIPASDGVIKGLTAGTTYKVRARVGNLSSEITLTPSVTGLSSSAAHTKTGNDLDGTDVTTTFTSPAQIVTDDISVWNFQLYKSDGTEPLREYTDADGSTTSDGSIITDEWPYLPQGAYKLKATATFKDGSTVSSMESIEVGAPDFSVTVSGMTSYRYYTSSSHGASVANTKNAETVYEVSSSITIAENILKNANYSKPTITYSVDNKTVSGTYSTSKSHTQGTISDLSWGNHTLTASVTFDQTPKIGTCDCVITGLPYKPTNMIEADWSLASWNCEYNNGIIQLGGVSGSGECSATSKMAFNLPTTVNVKINTNVTVRDMNTYVFGWCKTTFSLSVNNENIISQAGNKVDDPGKNYDLSGNSSFSSNSCTIKMNSSYEAAGPWSKVHSLHILYR